MRAYTMSMAALVALACAPLNACSEPEAGSVPEPIRVVRVPERRLDRRMPERLLQSFLAPVVTSSETDTLEPPLKDAREEAAQMYARDIDPYRVDDAVVDAGSGEEG